MIRVTVRFYAELNDFLPARRRQVWIEHAVDEPPAILVCLGRHSGGGGGSGGICASTTSRALPSSVVNSVRRSLGPPACTSLSTSHFDASNNVWCSRQRSRSWSG